ncbi:uncharacterized protein LOC114194505 [Vigna unguiculata]|uniref:uncharacterized protein LOC114194505 n=1 Tax=Vigna unguiculata TaxID=3917 RepID=UPI001016C1C2|nr:uncharacterized protein LOC114194505 [Vigna unguiculata]
MDPPTGPPGKKRKISKSQGTPSFDSRRFLTEDHQQWYAVVENRNLLPERKVVLQTGEHEEFQEELQRRKWSKLTKYAAHANVAVVKEFYANAMLVKAGEPTFKSFVRGKEISYSGRVINRFLGTELNLGPSGCQYVEWCNKKKDYLKVAEKLCKRGADYVTSAAGHKRRILRGDLVPLAQIWTSFLHSNISPCSHTSDITERRSQMVYAIMAGLSMDVGAIIAQEIHLTANSGSSGQLSFPSLITELCRRAGVDVSEPPFQKPRQPINAQFILKNCMGSETRAPVVRVTPPAVPGSVPHRLGLLETNQQLIHQKLDALYRSQVLMMSSIRSLIPGISQDSFHVPSAEEFDSDVAWPKHPEKKDYIEETDEHAVEKEVDEPAEEDGVKMLLMLRKKKMSSLENSTRSGANQGEGKQRSTSLPCRRNYAEVVEEINANPVAFVTGGNEQKEEFLGGPSDPSLLVSYVDHVAYKLWNGEDRGELKLVSHGRKLSKFGIYHPHIETYVLNSGLLPLSNISYETADKGLISAFVERWHRDTNSFHLPVGEMTITLDDVSTLLHISIVGQFCTYVPLEFAAAAIVLVDLLGVEQADATSEMRHCRGTHVRLSWLREVYEESCVQQRWECAARAYLLHLVGCTIFVDKSATSISVSYLPLFRDMGMCGEYSWGAAALTHMYEQLGDACFAQTKQLGGYATLVQAWIYEHFLGMGNRDIVPTYQEVQPRAARYVTGRHNSTVKAVRLQLDNLTHAGVIWNPYEAHRITRPFESITLFSGFIRLGASMHRHMPERVLRQYGYEQTVPRSPTTIDSADMSVIDERWLHFAEHLVTGMVAATSASACVGDYMVWYRSVSHPYILPSGEEGRPSVLPHQHCHNLDEGGRPTPSQQEHACSDVFNRIVNVLQKMIDCGDVTEGTPAWEGTQTILQLARGVIDGGMICIRCCCNGCGRHIEHSS